MIIHNNMDELHKVEEKTPEKKGAKSYIIKFQYS